MRGGFWYRIGLSSLASIVARNTPRNTYAKTPWLARFPFSSPGRADMNIGRIYPADHALEDQYGAMVYGWTERTHHTDRRVLNEECLHDLLTNCAWWETKMKETYDLYRGTLPMVSIRHDVVRGENGYRTVDG